MSRVGRKAKAPDFAAILHAADKWRGGNAAEDLWTPSRVRGECGAWIV